MSKHWREEYGLAYPKLIWGLQTLSLTTNSSWLPWGRVFHASHQNSDASTPCWQKSITLKVNWLCTLLNECYDVHLLHLSKDNLLTYLLCRRTHNVPPLPESWPLTLKVVSESRVTWATSVPILVFLGLSVLDLGPMYATMSSSFAVNVLFCHNKQKQS